MKQLLSTFQGAWVKCSPLCSKSTTTKGTYQMKQLRVKSPRTLRFAAPAVIVAAALGLAACGSSSSTSSTTTTSGSSTNASLAVVAPPTSSVALSETGSSLLFPLFGSWGTAYTQTYPNITLSTASTGSGVGISDALKGAANIGASDAYLSPAQVQATPTARNIPLAISSQFVGYNIPGVTAHLKLSGSVIASIYEGKITNWNNSAITSLNPGVKLPNLPIVTLHRSDGSGDTFLFSQMPLEHLAKLVTQGWFPVAQQLLVVLRTSELATSQKPS